jgi:putative tricarboxylic transport membrane protein
MEQQALAMAWHALAIVGDPMRLMYLAAGVLMGLVLGIIPGLGGLIGLSILLPFTFGLDPFAAIAMMLGLSAVTVTSDSIPAVLFSVPGTIGSAATVLDGFPMAKKGEAGRALGACYTASVLGGLFGAFVLGVSVPVLRPLVLLIGSPELFAICVFGLSLVAGLSANAPLKGMSAVCIGISVAMIGEDAQTATLRWTLGTNYLWDGLPIVPFVLGIFALPEMCDLAIARRAISGDTNVGSRFSQLEGARDVLRNWWLLLRCSSIGAVLGAVPGIGAAVIDWIAYGHAIRTEKGAAETFGKGDVRGVIACECSNNAKEGGALIPTVAFGVPGSASMALMLSAFLIHDIVPGPEMLTKHLDVTYALVWSVAIANILGAGICFLFANQLAKIAIIRIGVLAPLIVGVVFVGVYQSSASWGDLIALMVFGVIGWIMKRMNWPRPPVILGFVLGALFERYMYISVQRYDFDWLGFPIVVAIMAVGAYGMLSPIVRNIRRERRRFGGRAQLVFRPPARLATAENVFTLIVIATFGAAFVSSLGWAFDARLVPDTVALGGIVFAVLHFAGNFTHLAPLPGAPAPPPVTKTAQDESVIDLLAGLGLGTILSRALVFLAWCLFYLGATRLIGLLPAMFVFLVLYMRFQGGESWRTTLSVSVGTAAFGYVLFHRLVAVSWPQSLLGDAFPVLRSIEAINLF